MKRLAWLIVAFWPFAAMGQAPVPSPEPIPDTLASIKAEEASARNTFFENSMKAAAAQSTTEARAAEEAYRAKVQSLMDQALALARFHPGSHDGISATVWVASTTHVQHDDNIAKRVDAAFRLLADAPVLDDPEIALAMLSAESIGPRYPAIEPFLRAVLSRSRHPSLVTIARFSLGGYLAEMARMHDRLAAPISGPELLKTLTKGRLTSLRAIDGEKLRGEAEALLEQVVREQGDKPQTLGGGAANQLYRIRQLRIGQAAPELIGEDIDGAPIRLSDFRGKVVVVSFWPTAPAAYMLAFQEQDLVAAMKGRPFVLLGANVEENDRAKAKEAATQEGITWRSFWAGGRDGAILRKWHSRDWRPTVYTIDEKGIIRDDQVGDKLTPAAFEPLVREAEKAAR